MNCFKRIFVCLCTLAIFAIAQGCATDLSDQGLGNAEGGLDFSIDAASSADIYSDEEPEGEGFAAISLVAKISGTCKCNGPPDSSGNWGNPVETCSLCSTSEECATATCKYVHSVHNGLSKDVGCQFESGTYVIDAVRKPLDEIEEEDAEILEIEVRNGDLELLNEIAPVTGTCSCNPPPDSSGNWGNPVETCSLCSTSEECATATCKYVHAVHNGLSKDVGCQFSTSAIVVKPISDLSKDKPGEGSNGDEVDGLDTVKSDQSDESDLESADSEISFSLAGSCTCNPAPSTQGGWTVTSQNCSLCTNSADCATAECWYTNSDGDEEEVGCQYSSKLKKKKKKKKKKKIDGGALLDF